MEDDTPFDELITQLNKLGNKSDAKLNGSFLKEIKEIYLLMKDVSRSLAAICEILSGLTLPDQIGSIKNKMEKIDSLTVRKMASIRLFEEEFNKV